MKNKETANQLHIPDLQTKTQEYFSKFEELRGFL
jgi:hypothetical protein